MDIILLTCYTVKPLYSKFCVRMSKIFQINVKNIGRPQYPIDWSLLLCRLQGDVAAKLALGSLHHVPGNLMKFIQGRIMQWVML